MGMADLHAGLDAGDDTATGVSGLFRARYPEMVRLADLLGADDPEDIAQEAFARLIRKHGSLREPDQHGGITVAHGNAFTWTAYLVNGRVSFWSGRWLLAYSALPASGPPEVSVFFSIPGGAIPGPSGFYGYAHDDIARVTARLASGQLLTARTFPGWPASGLRLWVAPVPSGLRQAPKYVALGYDRAGHLVWQATHE